MKPILRSVLALLTIFTCCLAGVPDEVRQNLDQLVPETIRLLEANEYATVLETLVRPDEFKKFIGDGQLAEAAEQFGKNAAARLLELMKVVKDLKPTLSEDGIVATFDIPQKNSETHTKPMIFTKIDGKWFLNN